MGGYARPGRDRNAHAQNAFFLLLRFCNNGEKENICKIHFLYKLTLVVSLYLVSELGVLTISFYMNPLMHSFNLH